jgi:general secretion pathway protein G
MNMHNQTRIKLNFNIYRCPKSLHSAQKRSIKTAGFTLLELMIVVAIIGTLAAIAIPGLISYRTKAKIALAVSEIKILEQEIKLYETANMNLPNDLSEVTLGNMSDPWGSPYQYLKITEDDEDEDEDDNGKKKKGKKEKGKKKAKPREDKSKAQVNLDFDLYSMGKDGKSKSRLTDKASLDDIVRANDGNFIGLASEF